MAQIRGCSPSPRAPALRSQKLASSGPSQRPPSQASRTSRGDDAERRRAAGSSAGVGQVRPRLSASAPHRSSP